MNGDFRRYWCSESASAFGSALSTTAVAVVAVTVFDASTVQLGLLAAAGAAPAFLLGPVAGVFADRVRRPRRALVLADVAAAFAVGVLALGLHTGHARLWWLVLLTVVLGTVVTVTGTLYFTHLRRLVPADGLMAGRARLQSGEFAARTAGRAVAGPLIDVLGPAACLAVDAVTYALSALSLRSLRAPDRGADRPRDAAPPPLRRELTEGVRELARHPFLRALVLFAVTWAGLLAAIGVLVAPFLLRDLGFSAAHYGLVTAAAGCAGLAGSLLAARRAVTRHGARTLAVVGYGGAIVGAAVLPFAGGPAALASVLAVAGLGLPVLFGAIANVGMSGAATSEIPEEVLGRVIAALSTAATGAQLVGGLVGGVVGDVLGVRPALFALVAAGGLSLLLLARVRSASSERVAA